MGKDTTTWRKELECAFEKTGDKLEDLVITLTDEELDMPFVSDFGTSEAKPFMAWSQNFVYFYVSYDGSDQVCHVPRNPTTDWDYLLFG